MPRRRFAALLTVPLVLLGACSSSELSRDEFVDELETANPPVDPAISNCAFDEIAGDEALLDDLAENGVTSDSITVESSQKLEQIMARCILDVNAENESTDTTGG